MNHLRREDPEDAARWWQAYLLAEGDQVDELGVRAAAGDDHARRQLAGWLADRARTEEAIEVIRPLADAGDDVAELWLARWLADGDHLDELRQRAASGSYHAPRELAIQLASHDMHDELRDLASDSSGYHALRALAGWLAERDMHHELAELALAADLDRRLQIFQAVREAGAGGINVLRVLIDLGDDSARSRLARLLARAGRLADLQERAESGDDYARYWLAAGPGQP
jgi:hypothetical protein